jgi:stalled ribosome alternative rescue factor ArfA
MNKQVNKKTGEELQEYLAFRRRGSRVESRKGKGSFKRHQKHKGKEGE